MLGKLVVVMIVQPQGFGHFQLQWDPCHENDDDGMVIKDHFGGKIITRAGL